jgi:hypothetical protein
MSELTINTVSPDYVLSRLRWNEHGTFGEMIDRQGNVVIVILEPPPNGNQRGISSIPANEYVYERRWSDEHHCEVFGALNVPGRDDIEIHPGCLWPRDTKGCQLTGSEFGHVDYADGKPNASGEGVLGAQVAFKKWMALNEGRDHLRIRIVDPISTDTRTLAS